MSQTFTSVDDAVLVRLTSQATQRLVFIAPGIRPPVAEALAHAMDNVPPAAVHLVLDVDAEVCRLGYGDKDFKGMEILQAAAARHGLTVSYLFIEQIDTTLRAKILLFDWWTANGDRTLTEDGGNPNILWVHRDQKPYVIDHNNAFDEPALADFWSQHIFAATRPAWTNTFRHDTELLMKAALTNLDQWWKDMPPEWTDDYTGLTLQQVQTLLWRFETNPAIFWGVA